MNGLLISSIGREDPPAPYSNSLHVFDLDLRETKKTFCFPELPPVNQKFETPGLRGGLRGIVFLRGYWYVAVFNGLYVLDREFSIVKTHSFVDIFDIHKIYVETLNSLLILNTGGDSIYRMKIKTGKVSSYRTFKHWRYLSKSKNPNWDDYLHVNCLEEITRRYAVFNNPGVIFDLWKTDVALQDHENLGGCHDLIEINDFYVILDSVRKRILKLRRNEQKLEIDEVYYVDYYGGEVSDKNKAGWVRGACYDELKDCLYVGSSPGRLLIFPEASSSGYRQVEEETIISDPADSPFDLKLIQY